MHYVVATDGSTVSNKAVRYAAEHAAAMEVTLEIVHVIAPETTFVDGELVQPSEAKLLDDGREILDRARDLATDTADVTVETELLTGRPADARRARDRDRRGGDLRRTPWALGETRAGCRQRREEHPRQGDAPRHSRQVTVRSPAGGSASGTR